MRHLTFCWNHQISFHDNILQFQLKLMNLWLLAAFLNLSLVVAHVVASKPVAVWNCDYIAHLRARQTLGLHVETLLIFIVINKCE